MPRTLPLGGGTPAVTSTPQFLGCGEITDQRPADTTSGFPSRSIPPPSSTKAFPGQPPFLPFLSGSSYLLKEPRENSVSSGGPWMSWQRHRHIHRQWPIPTPHWGPLGGVSSVPGIVSTIRGTHILTRELQCQFLHLSRLKTDHLYAMYLLC